MRKKTNQLQNQSHSICTNCSVNKIFNVCNNYSILFCIMYNKFHILNDLAQTCDLKRSFLSQKHTLAL